MTRPARPTTDPTDTPDDQLLDDASYLMLQQQLLALGIAVAGMPLSAFLRRIDRAHALGPVLDPTAYRAAMDHLQAVEDLARGLLAFQAVALRLADTPAG